MISVIKSNVRNLHIRATNIEIPANGDVVIDLSAYIPANLYVWTIRVVQLGSYVFPYVSTNGENLTFMSGQNTVNRTIKITNRTSAWHDYDLYATVELGDN